MTKIRTAIIGCGKVGATHALAYQNLDNSQFSAVCGVSPENINKFSKSYNVPGYTDVEKMIRENDIQAVSICTPHPLHAELICCAAGAGAHVICEKPLASSLQDCDRAIDACKKAGVKLSVVSQRRYYWPVVRMVEAIRAGKIGRPIIGTMTVLGWRSPEYYLLDPWRGKWKEEGGGVMVNQTVHQLDLLQWIMGPIKEVFGYWDNFNHGSVEIEDTAAAVLRFQNGAIGQFLVSNSQKPGFYGKVHIHGENGASVGVQVEGGTPYVSGMTSVVEPSFNDIWTIPGEMELLTGWQQQDREMTKKIDPMNYFHELQIQDFLNAIITDCDPPIDGYEGRKAVELFTAVYRSQRDGKPVKFPLKIEKLDDFDGRLSYRPFSKR
ncbi:MAG: Gfo/Idh/MocA family protein [Flexilinea sp.]